MRRGRAVLMVGGVTALLMLGFTSAHASGPAVAIDTTGGSAVVSGPQSQWFEYPAGVPLTVNGTASFDAGKQGDVLVQLAQTPFVNTDNPGQPADPVVVFTGSTDITCDQANLCTWSFRVPFIITPGTYQVTALATQAPDSESGSPLTATSNTIDVTIL